jgi:hypothetical protein
MLKINRRFCKILSTGLLAGILVMGTSVNTFAEVDSIVVYDSDNNINYEYNMDDLKESIKQYMRKGEAPLYEDFSELITTDGNKILAYHDDINGYIDTDSILKAVRNAVRNDKDFDLNDFTESDEAEQIVVETSMKTEVDGKVVEEEQEDFRVIGIK